MVIYMEVRDSQGFRSANKSNTGNKVTDTSTSINTNHHPLMDINFGIIS